jgi:hypothetical protein
VLHMDFLSVQPGDADDGDRERSSSTSIASRGPRRRSSCIRRHSTSA